MILSKKELKHVESKHRSPANTMRIKLERVIELLWEKRNDDDIKSKELDDFCDIVCDHPEKEKTYQPREPENNIGEDFFCETCGRSFADELE